MAKKVSEEQLIKMRHSAAHLLAAAVLQLRPEAKPAIGPAIEDGFYYDFDFAPRQARGKALTEKDLPKIEAKMSELLPSWTAFSHREVSAAEARELFKGNPYKLELIDEIEGRGEPITLYTAGPPRSGFTDLCRGGHVAKPSKEVGAFKLLSVAGAYWRGDETKPMLTRIYGALFSTRKELEEHLRILEEAKARDHRRLGKELDLFVFSPLVGPGLPLFTPRGTIIRQELESFLRTLQDARGYSQVHIPHLAKAELYRRSGHWDKFKDNLLSVAGKYGEELVIKPMNCPHHIQLYASRPRSYRDLPLRFAETTTVYRDEKPGEILGLARVRSITQDDAHVFCTSEQLSDEIKAAFDLVREFYSAFSFELEPHLSVRDPKTLEKYLGEDGHWEQAEAQLAESLQESGMAYERDEGEAAFYGPKIDFVARDSLRRRWQLATIQLDFNMPARFRIAYTAADGSERTPVMIHRAISGSVERFLAILLEHYAGRLPLWLAPVQVALLPITDDQLANAREAAAALQTAGVRAEVDGRAESIGKKIRDAEAQRVPVMFVIGKREVAEKRVSVRTREQKDAGSHPLPAAVTAVAAAVHERRAAAKF